LNSQELCGGVYLEPSGGNFVQNFSLGSKADDFKSRDVGGADLPTACLPKLFRFTIELKM